MSYLYILGLDGKKKRRKLKKAEEQKILKRQSWKCAGRNCNVNLKPRDVAIRWDHRKPIALGGSDTLRNIQALCLSCHDKKTRDDRSKIAKGKAKQKSAFNVGDFILGRN